MVSLIVFASSCQYFNLRNSLPVNSKMIKQHLFDLQCFLLSFPADCSMCSSYTHCDEDVGACLCARCDHVTQSPVCGSDLQTYLSACHLYRDACVHKRHTTLAYAGYCKDPFHELTGMNTMKTRPGV